MSRQFFSDLWAYWGNSRLGGFYRFMLPFSILLSLTTLALHPSLDSDGINGHMALACMIGLIRMHHDFWKNGFAGTIVQKTRRVMRWPQEMFVLSSANEVGMLDRITWKQAEIGDYVEKPQRSFEMKRSRSAIEIQNAAAPAELTT